MHVLPHCLQLACNRPRRFRTSGNKSTAGSNPFATSLSCSASNRHSAVLWMQRLLQPSPRRRARLLLATLSGMAPLLLGRSAEGREAKKARRETTAPKENLKSEIDQVVRLLAQMVLKLDQENQALRRQGCYISFKQNDDKALLPHVVEKARQSDVSVRSSNEGCSDLCPAMGSVDANDGPDAPDATGEIQSMSADRPGLSGGAATRTGSPERSIPIPPLGCAAEETTGNGSAGF